MTSDDANGFITFGSVEDIILPKYTKSFSRIHEMHCSMLWLIKWAAEY